MRTIELREVSYAGRYTCSFCGTIIELDDDDLPDGEQRKQRYVGTYGASTAMYENVPYKSCPSCSKDIDIRGKSIPA